MKGISKFDFGAFYGGEIFFAVSKQRYTLEEAYEIFRREHYIAPEDFDTDSLGVKDMFVRHRAGIDENGPCVGLRPMNTHDLVLFGRSL